MKIGMLWFDNSANVGFEDKVKKAAAYYKNKYGRVANLVFVHPTMTDVSQVEDIAVRTTRSVRPHHFWLGVDSESKR